MIDELWDDDDAEDFEEYDDSAIQQAHEQHMNEELNESKDEDSQEFFDDKPSNIVNRGIRRQIQQTDEDPMAKWDKFKM